MIIIVTQNPEFLQNIDSDFNYFWYFDHLSDEFTSEDFKSDCRQFNVGSFHLKILAFNVCTFFKRVNQFISLLCTTSCTPDVTLLVETWLNLNNKQFCFCLFCRFFTYTLYCHLPQDRILQHAGGADGAPTGFTHWSGPQSPHQLCHLS